MRTLFIDFDGTICTDRFWRGLGQEAQKKIQQELFGTNKQIVNDWMIGKYSSEEIHEIVARATGLSHSNIWKVFVRDCETMRVPSELLSCIERLRGKFHTVLITGNMDCFDRFTVPALDLNQYFDLIVNSYNERELKTDNNGKSFLKYVQGNIVDAVLIDDNARCCELFEALGGTASRSTGTKSTLQILQSL